MMAPKKLLILAGCASGFAICGCNFAPHYEPPKTDAAGTFKEAVPGGQESLQGWKLAQPNDTLVRGKWWELYRDPQLNDLEARVAISNQNVAAAEANYRSARALLSEARAAYFPTFSVVPSVVRSRSSASGSSTSSTAVSSVGTSGTATSGTTTSGTATSGAVSTTALSAGQPNPRTDYTLPLEASYEVDLWGSVRNSVAQSSYSAQASAANVEAALLSTQSALAQAYFGLRVTDQERRVLDTTLDDYEASLHLVQTLYDNGLASDEDLAEADTQLASAQAQATDLGVARAQYEHAIAVLIGVPPSRFSLPVGKFSAALPAVPVGLPADLLERRPDVAAAERQVAAANAGIGVARAAYFPQLTLNASAGFLSTGLSKLFDWPNRMWSIGPTASQPLFDGGYRRAENAQARALYDATVANYRQTVLSAFQAVEDNLASLRILSKEVSQQHKAALSAKRTVELSVVRYKNGIDSFVNVITAQNTFLTNRLSELQVQLRQLTASVLLVNNLGGGWDRSQWSATEQMALHPSEADGKAAVPPEDAGPGVPNPAPLPGTSKSPEQIVDQNAAEMAPAPDQ